MTDQTNDQPRRDVLFEDEQGVPCRRVSLDDEGQLFAQIWEADFQYLVRGLGVTPTWSVTEDGKDRKYVAVLSCSPLRDDCGLVTIARLIVGALPKQCVRYANGDTMDLRRPNLVIREGASRHDSVQRLVAANEDREAVKATKKAKKKGSKGSS